MDTIIVTPQHKYQILTKRAKRMNEYFSTHEIPKNAWLGVTVDTAKSKERIDFLRELPATIKFPWNLTVGAFAKAGFQWLNKVHHTFQHFEVYKIYRSQSPLLQMRC